MDKVDPSIRACKLLCCDKVTSSECSTHRIKKIYGAESGIHVLNALHENPCTTVPIVLARLKQKEEEWKRALRDWNRVWRETDAKNFYRALDHKGITVKINDKKMITPKALVTEIETIKREQQQRRITFSRGSTLRPLASRQLEYLIADEDVLFDVIKLTLSYLDRINGVYAGGDKDKIETFLRTFVPALFCVSQQTTDAYLVVPEPIVAIPAEDAQSEAGDGASEAGASVSAAEDESTTSTGRGRGRGRGGRARGDLRRKALHKAAGPSERNGRRNGAGSKANSPAPTANDSEVAESAASSREPTPETAAEQADTPMQDSTQELADGVDAALIDAQTIDTQDAPLETDVPATAGGLEGMTGVETVQVPMDGAEQLAQQPAASSPAESTDTPIASLSVPEKLGRATSPGEPLLSHRNTADRVAAGTRHSFNFFCGSTHYCLLRIVQVRFIY